MLSTHQKGALAEAEITAAAIRLGVGVYKPVMEGGRFDLVLETESRLYRVQCKFARLHGEVVRVCCFSTRRAREGLRKRVYRVAEVDFIAVYCLDLDRCFLLSGDEFDGRTQVDLRIEPCRNNQRTGVNRAADFDFAARLVALLGP